MVLKTPTTCLIALPSEKLNICLKVKTVESQLSIAIINNALNSTVPPILSYKDEPQELSLKARFQNYTVLWRIFKNFGFNP